MTQCHSAGNILSGLQIEVRWVRVVERLKIALLPMAEEITVQHAGPANAPFEESELQRRETARHTIHEQRFAYRLTSGRKVSDMVVNKVGIRRASADALRGGVEGWDDVEFDAFRPHRIVVVGAIESKCIGPRCIAIRSRPPFAPRRRAYASDW